MLSKQFDNISLGFRGYLKTNVKVTSIYMSCQAMRLGWDYIDVGIDKEDI